MRAHMLAVAKKDLLILRRSPSVYLPMVLLPTLLSVAIPLVIFAISSIPEMPNSLAIWVKLFIERMPAGSRAELTGFNQAQLMQVVTFKYFFMTLFLIIPVAAVSLFGSDSLAGERERKTIEAVLYTPLTMKDLWIGKLAALLAVGSSITFASFALYVCVVNIGCHSFLDHYLLPDARWLATVLLIVPLVTILSGSCMLFISAKVNSAMAAQQISVLILLPVLALFLSQLASGVSVSLINITIAGGFLAILDAVLVALGIKVAMRRFGELV